MVACSALQQAEIYVRHEEDDKVGERDGQAGDGIDASMPMVTSAWSLNTPVSFEGFEIWWVLGGSMLCLSVWRPCSRLFYAFNACCTLLLSVHPLIQFLSAFFFFRPILFCHHHSSCACISSLYHFSSFCTHFCFRGRVLTFRFLFLLCSRGHGDARERARRDKLQ